MTVGERLLPFALLGSLLAACAPAEESPPPRAPTVVAPQTPTRATTQVLRGSKPASTAIEINGLLASPLDELTEWYAEVSLENGLNRFSIVAVDVMDRRSRETATSILVDLAAPPAPSVDAPDYPTLRELWTLTGRADVGADVLVDGVVASRGADGAFARDLALELGANPVRVSAMDAVGNESAATSVTLTRTTFSFSVEPPPALVPSSTVTLRGRRGGGVDVEVNGAVRVPRDATGGAWTIDVPLSDGENLLEVRGVHPEGADAGQSFVVRSDTAAPPPPMLDAVPDLVTSAGVTLSGTRAADTAVVVNGVVVAASDAATSFSTTAPLALGLNTLDVRARDEAGNESPPVAPAPVVYRDPNGIHLVVEPLPPRVASAGLTLGGAKAGNVAVFVEGAAAAAADGATTWSHAVTLAAGVNVLDVVARVGPVSRTVTVVVEYLPDGPAAASVSLPLYVAEPLLLVGGAKPAGTGVVRGDGSPVAVVDETTTFQDELTLSAGANELSWITRDAFGRLGPSVGGTVTLDQTGPSLLITEPREGEVVGGVFELDGTLSDDGEVSGVELCVGSDCLAGGTWQAASFDAATFSALVSTTPFPSSADGTLVELHVRAVDAAGNMTSLPVRELMLLREPVAAGADAAFDQASGDLDVDVGPARELHAAFHHPSAHGGDVYLLVEDGLSYSGLGPTLLSGVDYGASSAPRVAADDSGIAHVAWLADGAMGSASPGAPGVVYRSVDGVTVSAPDVLEATGGCDALDLAVSPSGLVAVVWRRALTLTTYALELVVHDGAGWSAPVTVAADGDGTSVAPALPSLSFSDDDTLHLVWQDEGSADGSADDADVLHRTYAEASGLGAITLVSSSDGGLVDGVSLSPRVAAVPGSATHTAFVGWIESGAVSTLGAGVDKAVVRRVADDGLGTVRDASDVPGRVAAGEIDVGVTVSGELVVVFTDSGDILSSGTDRDVFLRASAGAFGGVVAVSDRRQNAASIGESRLPRVAVDELGNAHVLWLEESDLTGSVASPADVDPLYFAIGENQR